MRPNAFYLSICLIIESSYFLATVHLTPIQTTTSSSSNSNNTLLNFQPQNVTHQTGAKLPVAQEHHKQQQQQQPQHTQSSQAPTFQQTISSVAGAPSDKNCSAACTSIEFTLILQKIASNTDLSSLIGAKASKRSTGVQTIRSECVRELIGIIKRFASTELELKNAIGFVSGQSLPLRVQTKTGAGKSVRAHKQQSVRHFFELVSQSKSLSKFAASQNQSSANESAAQRTQTAVEPPSLVGAPLLSSQDDELGQSNAVQLDLIAANEIGGNALEKSQVLPKLVLSVNHWVETFERFTATQEWSSLVKIFEGFQSILRLFDPADLKAFRKQTQTQTNKTDEEVLANLRSNLPKQVQTVTSALNDLFPWHVWPWNNLDLYTTIDTFLSHGLFAFQKTTLGPERRIDYLPEMVKTLFNALKYDSFPRKCSDWSKVICDLDLFYERLVLEPMLEVEQAQQAAAAADLVAQNATSTKAQRLKQLTGVENNRLTQELVCIMFSSLSIEKFGGKDALRESSSDEAVVAEVGESAPLKAAHKNQLSWSKQVLKGLKLYTLSREALSDEQVKKLYAQIKSLWSQLKVSDRVVMVGRVIQSLTSCHIPKEILESALWKDIYKYKNVLNQISDIVIEELNRSSETDRFEIAQLSLGSKSLDEILRRFVGLLPKLIVSLSRTLLDELPDLVNKFFNEKAAFFEAPCKGYSFSELIPSLQPYRDEIVELERLLCLQLKTKPSISMMQINHLTNDFLAMAFNFSSFSQSLPAIPRFWGQLETAASPAGGSVRTQQAAAAAAAAAQQQQQLTAALNRADTPAAGVPKAASANNVSSVVDELAANPRFAQIVAILQSSALDPPEVHAELPELDWVEAGKSVALLYESVQRLLSHENEFVVFPEVANFQRDIMNDVKTSQQMFQRFSKYGPLRMVAYVFDTAMPIAIRTFSPMDSFNSECQSTLKELLGEAGAAGSEFSAGAHPPTPVDRREARHWQCVLSGANFASHAINKLIKTFNVMLKSVMGQLADQKVLNEPSSGVAANSTSCIFLDGSINVLLDNLPQLFDLAIETLLIASTSSEQQPVALLDALCSSKYVVLDTSLSDQREALGTKRDRIRSSICRLLDKQALKLCGDVMKSDEWISTIRSLNVTWFESNVIQVEPSFRYIVIGIHEFLDLSTKIKPSSMSDGLIARVLNINSYISTLINKIMSNLEKYREKRFELGMQILSPVVYDNLLARKSAADSSRNQSELGAAVQQQVNETQTTKDTLIRLISIARGVSVYLAANSQAQNSTALDVQLPVLFAAVDKYSLVGVETFLRTIANQPDKLGHLFSGRTQNISLDETLHRSWTRFCNASVDTYLYFEPSDEAVGKRPLNESSGREPNKATVLQQTRLVGMEAAQKFICDDFDWKAFAANLSANSASGSESLDKLPVKHLTRLALRDWGHVVDLIATGDKKYPKLMSISYWQPLQEKLAQISSPARGETPSMLWIWTGIEQFIVSSADLGFRNALVRVVDQLNCGLDVVKGGLTWDNAVNIYQDRHDVLAVHSTISNSVLLADAALDVFFEHKKFQRFLDEFVAKARGSDTGSFCELRDRSKLSEILSLNEQDQRTLLDAFESFQELLCDTNIDILAQNINPVSVCYQSFTGNSMATTPPSTYPIAGGDAQTHQSRARDESTGTSGGGGGVGVGPLAEVLDRFFKLGSLAVLDAKLTSSSSSEALNLAPTILQKGQWALIWNWWTNQTETRFGKNGLALTFVRIFQTLDSINKSSPAWRTLFRGVHEVSEIIGYLNRASDNGHYQISQEAAAQTAAVSRQATSGAGNSTRVAPPPANNSTSSQQAAINSNRLAQAKEMAKHIETAIKRDGAVATNLLPQQHLATTLSSIMFPDDNNFISLRTFKQLRHLKSLTDFFATTSGAQESICRPLLGPDIARLVGGLNASLGGAGVPPTKLELINYSLDSEQKLTSVLCHYQPSQWLSALNIVLTKRTSSMSKKINYMHKYLSLFARRNLSKQSNDVAWRQLQDFVHGQQMENIEAVANTSITYFAAISHPFRSLTISKISNMSWHSLPSLLDSINGQLCASRHENEPFRLTVYEPKKPDIETILCKLPQWNMTQVYNYFIEKIDLQTMISLAIQDNSTAALFGITTTAAAAAELPFETLAADQRNVTSTTAATMALMTTTTTTASSGANSNATNVKSCTTPFKFASKWLKIGQELIDELLSKTTREKVKKCLGLTRKGQSVYSQTVRYTKLVNSILASMNSLPDNETWRLMKKTWTSLTHHVLSNQSSKQQQVAQQSLPAAAAPMVGGRQSVLASQLDSRHRVVATMNQNGTLPCN